MRALTERPEFYGMCFEPGLWSTPLYADDRRLYPLYDLCSELSLPALIMGGGNAGPNITYTAPALLDHIGQHLRQQIELHAAGVRLEALGQQARIATDLAQLEQRVEDHDLAAREAAARDLFLHALVHRDAHGLVEVALRSGQLHAAHDLRLLR